MRKKIMALAGAAVVTSALLGACQEKPSQPTASAAAAAPVADSTAADTLRRVRGPKEKVPFVAPTKIGRILGAQSPSPPGTR
ncbi:hypothetical protein ACFST9_17985 [Hymenobacter monticola]|uniref:Uncharacterized protein n=1 Tax=Hymenobacter monticola TaxID=1705399 RepID=A0ABY4AZ84_9BACT|nr:hypothetical protein [Hymenobacter monticola]UOE32202.1 hypothetical protein MTP16_13790 [Hymenobacter monticola]